MTNQPLALQLLHLLSTQSMGRRRLAEASGLTEMVVRQALDELRKLGLVRAERTGFRLTEVALAQYSSLFEGVRSVVPLSMRLFGEPNTFLAGHLTRTPSEPAWALRDIALSRGATGLIILSYSDREWRFAHDGEPLKERNPADAETTDHIFPNPLEEDCLIAITAPCTGRAGLSLWAVIATVLKSDLVEI